VCAGLWSTWARPTGEAELAALIQAGREKIRGGQGVLDLAGLTPRAARQAAPAVVVGQRSALLWDVLCGAYEALGLDEAVGGDKGFRQMVLARLVEPTGKEQVPAVLGELGVDALTPRSLFRSLARCASNEWRAGIQAACLRHVSAGGDLSLCLYDVTTLYFEVEKEDSLRRVGYSKERRVDPQVIVGLLVDRAGFPLQIGCGRATRPKPAR